MTQSFYSKDTVGGGFSESESYVGQIAYLDIWRRAIGANEVQEFYTSCEPYQGNMLTWTDTKINIKGSVKIQKSLFCKPCEKNLVLQNGVIDYNDQDNYAYHQCEDGYKLEGSHIRNCLRTSQWQLPAPSCKCE
jgi:sushi, von Willebrand factor type A, EGF and pentraxin domain-containing protein 1